MSLNTSNGIVTNKYGIIFQVRKLILTLNFKFQNGEEFKKCLKGYHGITILNIKMLFGTLSKINKSIVYQIHQDQYKNVIDTNIITSK